MNMDLYVREMGDNTGSYLKLILGPMFSGKTSQLIRIYKHNQKRVVAGCFQITTFIYI